MKSIPCVKNAGYDNLLPEIDIPGELEIKLPLYEKQHIVNIRSSCYLESVDYLKRRRSLPNIELNY